MVLLGLVLKQRYNCCLVPSRSLALSEERAGAGRKEIWEGEIFIFPIPMSPRSLAASFLARPRTRFQFRAFSR